MMSVLSTLARFRPKLKEAARLETTQLQLINLDVLEAQYKDKWPRVKERIFDTCEQFISKRIGSDDLILCAANGFIVLPGPSRAEEAEAFTRRIETELKAFFLGTIISLAWDCTPRPWTSRCQTCLAASIPTRWTRPHAPMRLRKRRTRLMSMKA
ncbi:MAG: hypothetical protein JJU26_07330 [Oceanicaulis sp.]|nr:hypothetical protein [Oceanicaulis sp.]